MPLPGDPDAIDAACRQLTAVVSVVGSTGDSVARHGRAITADWTGLAAPLALARTQQDAANVQRVAQAAHDSVAPLMRYAEELRAAQQDYVRGEAMLAHGRVEASGLLPEGAPAADAARDRAQHTMDEGAALMRAAEERAQVANDAAAHALDAASSSLAGIAPAPPTPTAASTSPMAEVGNSASFGRAVLEHPLDGLAVLGGGALAAVSAAGVVGSLALDGTGVGALAGVPLGGVSAAGVAAGIGIAGAGLLDLATHASTDSAVAPFQVNQEADDSRVIERARTVGEPGKNKRVRVVETEEEVRALYDELSEGGTPIERRGYDGEAVVLPGGTEVGLRETSRTNDVTVDVQPPGGNRMRVHRK